jgi:hypothetical protein
MEAVGLVLVGFVLAMVWDLAKFRRDRGARERAAIIGLQEEMGMNRDRLANNQKLLEHEVTSLLPQQKTLVNPLDRLTRGAWEDARLVLPRKLAQDAMRLTALRDYARRVDQVNEMIRSREMFKLQTALAMPPPIAVATFAELLNTFQEELIDVIDANLRALELERPSRLRSLWSKIRRSEGEAMGC